MIYLFNELSLTRIHLESIAEAKRILQEFVKTSIIAKEYGFDELRIHESINNLYNFNLLENYRIDTWLNDNEVDNDIRDKFREIITSSPLVREEEIDELRIYGWSLFSVIFNNEKVNVFGLGATYVFNSTSISLDSNPEWNKTKLKVLHETINDLGEEENKEIEVNNFSNEKNLKLHKERIEAETADNISKSLEMWEKRHEYFPHLLFGSEIEQQLKKIGLNKQFYQTYNVLKKLNDFTKNWNNGSFSLKDLKEQTLLNVSGESASTMQKFSAIRKFKIQDGSKEQFELHVKIPNLRIYFLPHDLSHEITIGYIGKHLRIASMD